MTETIIDAQFREKGFAAASSVAAAIFLTTMKLVIGLMTGSLGILAEAAHSGLDLVAALITFFAVRVSDRPADESHLYGHGKVENLSALAETILLLVTCAWIIYEAFDRLFISFKEVDPSIWAFATMGISIIIDFSRSRVLAHAAKKYHSQALEADALHFSTDIYSSSVVIAGLALVKIGELASQKAIFVRADALAALAVAIIVIFISVQLGKRTIDALLDRAPLGMRDAITQAAGRIHDVQGVSNVRVRGVGSRNFVDMHVSVPRHLSFEESHAITSQVQEAIRSISPNADVVVHAVPVAENEGVLERIQAIAAKGHFSVHNITTHWTGRGMWIDLDLEVDRTLTLERAHALATDLEKQLKEEFEKVEGDNHPKGIADINVHIEPREQELLEGKELSLQDSRTYINEIESIRREAPRVSSIRDIQLQRLNEKVYLSFHLIVDPDCSVSEIHSVAEEIENRLRRRLPQLGRVVIHGEPISQRRN
jgi:cation diffusion facilitator family transporter